MPILRLMTAWFTSSPQTSHKMVGQQTLKTFYTNYTIIAGPVLFAANVMVFR